MFSRKQTNGKQRVVFSSLDSAKMFSSATAIQMEYLVTNLNKLDTNWWNLRIDEHLVQIFTLRALKSATKQLSLPIFQIHFFGFQISTSA